MITEGLRKYTLKEAQNLVRAVRSSKVRATPQFGASLRPLEEETQKTLKPLSESISLLPTKRSNSPLSNVLYYKTRNQYLKISDFEAVWKRDSTTFDLGKDIPKISLFRGREPHNLMAGGGYYLIFESVELAAAYLVDNLGSQINGTNAYFEMVNIDHHLKYLGSPILHDPINISGTRDSDVLKIEESIPRDRCVLVKGFPTFISKNTIEQMLWRYDLEYRVTPIRTIVLDNLSKVGMWLIIFATSNDSARFVREFHGYHFNLEERLPKVFASMLD
jgi:hypothetical protein